MALPCSSRDPHQALEHLSSSEPHSRDDDAPDPPRHPEGEDSSSAQNENSSHLPVHSRHTSSKYDFVKVRVWLGENSDHYYVLSRFLLSRMLTVTKIPNHVAIKISLELKKLLIDNSLLDVSQTDLEANLFKLMERRGYGEEYINRYKMITRFHHQRVPLVILVCGTACVGKSTVATQLAQRLNLPNVLQTDMVYELIRTSTDAPLPSTPIWEREFSSQEELVTEFARECRILRKGLHGDLRKAMKDGKPIIIEGIHLDPSIYLINEDNSNMTNDMKRLSITQSEAIIDGEEFAKHLEDARISEDTKSITSKGNAKRSLLPEAGIVSSPEKERKKTYTKAIVVPIVLKMDEFDHKTLLEEWVACRSTKGALINEEEKEALISRLMTIQDYLCSFKSQGIIVKNISATSFPQTLDSLHSYLLQRIEEGCLSTNSDTRDHK